MAGPNIRGLVDIRDRLSRNPNGGPNRSVDLSQKRNAVVHYNGPALNLALSDVQIWQADAHYHAFVKDWDEQSADGLFLHGDGIMYHIGIARDGAKYQLRDLNAVLWHCGRWPQNATTFAINVPIGAGQRATRDQLRALEEVCRDLIDQGYATREGILGHRELQPTSCPGTLMEDFILPFREGARQVADGMYFEQTGYYVGGGFWAYYRRTGGIIQHGLPLSEEIKLRDEKGIVRTSQIFERTIFEHHPELPQEYHVLERRIVAEFRDVILKEFAPDS